LCDTTTGFGDAKHSSYRLALRNKHTTASTKKTLRGHFSKDAPATTNVIMGEDGLTSG